MKDLILHYIPENCANIDHLIIPVKPKKENKPVNPKFEKNVKKTLKIIYTVILHLNVQLHQNKKSFGKDVFINTHNI